MPVDHFSLTVPTSRLEEVVSFLTSSLQHLGFKEIIRPIPTVVGMGERAPYFWINTVDIDLESEEGNLLKTISKRQHIAFSAEDKEQVTEFHTSALSAGATCNGPPGFREHYHPGYFAAFVFDPVLGINFEVVCHKAVA